MSDVTLSEDVIKLVQYTIVTIKRGEERILQRGEKMVVDPMDDAGFDSWVIADYTASHPIPPGDQMYLRVFSEILDSWDKQPLHYEEKQLRVLEDISRKIAPTAN